MTPRRPRRGRPQKHLLSAMRCVVSTVFFQPPVFVRLCFCSYKLFGIRPYGIGKSERTRSFVRRRLGTLLRRGTWCVTPRPPSSVLPLPLATTYYTTVYYSPPAYRGETVTGGARLTRRTAAHVTPLLPIARFVSVRAIIRGSSRVCTQIASSARSVPAQQHGSWRCVEVGPSAAAALRVGWSGL